ncbi:MAG: class I SAM-dependent methyltransferase [Lachnospiraceae bacterium]|nr:class I SAM-dependent methyltransferase [Lachnospiraceae bacterium]
MDETPYEQWCEYIQQVITKYGISKPRLQGDEEQELSCYNAVDTQETQDKKCEQETRENALRSERDLVLDLGCGTGTLTEMLAEKGYDMIGVDLSAEMLAIAMGKRQQAESGTLYLCQDMRDFELYSTVGTVLSVCDSVNYLLDEEDVLQTFQLVNNYLYPGGIFLFDFNTVYKYEQVIGDTTIAESREDCSFIWENFYDPEEQLNEYDLTIFVKTDAGDEEPLFRRFQETHVQRGYTLEQMSRLVKEAGMEVVFAIDADTHDKVTAESERIYILAKEVRKHE